MAVLSCEEVDSLIRNAVDQTKSERILYEGRMIEAVRDRAHSKGIPLIEMKPDLYVEQWMLMNLPQIQSDKSAMQIHYEKVMVEKFEYYNRINNYEASYIWVGSMLKNIGFTDYQANMFLTAVHRIGQQLYKRANKID